VTWQEKWEDMKNLIASPDEWPTYPYLAMMRREDRDPNSGVLFADNTCSVILGRINALQQPYQTRQTTRLAARGDGLAPW
jgi:hypothetical protein